MALCIYTDDSTCKGSVDTLTGFSLVSLPEETFVWNHSSTSSAPPACYIFPNPASSLSAKDLPLSSFVPYQSSQEPGLMLISTTGDLRFWVNVSLGLTGGESYYRVRVPVSTSERVLQIHRIEVRRSFCIKNLGLSLIFLLRQRFFSQQALGEGSSGSTYRLQVVEGTAVRRW